METFPLQKGSSGQRVKILQQGLNMLAELRELPDRLEADGQFGEKTKALLYKVLNVTTVTEAFWKKLETAFPYALNRLAEFRRTGKSADSLIAKVVANEASIFHWLLRTYATWDKLTPAQRKPLQPAFDAAFNIAARQRLRVAKYNTAARDILWQRGVWDPKYTPLVKKYVEGHAVFGNQVGAVQIGVIAAIAIGALIIGAISTVAVINWMTPAYSESTVDFKKTKEIQEILDKLPKEDQAILEKAVEEQIDKAYVTGKRDGKFGGSFNVIKAVAAAACLLFLYETYGRPRVNAHYRK